MLIKITEHFQPVKSLTKPQLGIVVDNEDPEKLGRVKCTIEKIFVGEKDLLPWIALPVDPNRMYVPKVGSKLRIEFPYNDIYYPVAVGYWHDKENHSEYFDDDYPNSFGLESDNLKMKFNDKTKAGEVVHSSGTKATISDDGTLEIEVAKDLKIKVTGNYEITADGDIKFTATGALEVVTDGSAKFAGKGGTDVGDAGSVTNVNGTQVMLAGGGVGIATLGMQCMGTGNLGSPVICSIIEGSTKVMAPK